MDEKKPALEAPPPDRYVPPVGTQNLLDAQLGEALRIMRDFANWIHSPSSAIEECCHVSHTFSALLTASATLANVSRGLQQGQAESRHRTIVEYATPGEGGGEKSKTNK